MLFKPDLVLWAKSITAWLHTNDSIVLFVMLYNMIMIFAFADD